MRNRKGQGPFGRGLGPIFMIVLAAVLALPQPAEAQWTRTDWPGGGSVFSLAAIGQEVFAGTYEGVFVSADGGRSWISRSDGLPSGISETSLVALAGVLYAGCRSNGIYVSSNGGKLWAPLQAAMPKGTVVNCLTACGPNLVVGTTKGVSLCTDNGRSWTTVRSKPLEDRSIFWLTSDGSAVFAGSYYRGDILQSTDGGASWTLVASEPRMAPGHLTLDGREMFSGTDAGVLRSTDGGVTWTAASSLSGLPAVRVTSFLRVEDHIFAGTDGAGVFISTDRGAHWKAPGGGLSQALTPLAIQAIGPDIFAAVEKAPLWGGVLRSGDGGRSWSWSCTGLPARGRVQCLASSGRDVLAGTTEGLFRSGDRGVTWSAVGHKVLTGAHVEFLKTTGAALWAGTRGEGLFRSDDGGQTWVRLSDGLPASATIAGLSEAGESLVCAANQGLYVSRDHGGTWQVARTGLPPSASGLCVAAIGSKSFAGIGVIIQGTYSKSVKPYSSRVEGRGVYIAQGTEMNWAPANQGMPKDAIVFCLVEKNGILFAGTRSDGLFVSFDGAKSWRGLNKGLPKNAFVASIGFNGSDIIIGLAGGAGIYRGPIPMIPNGI